MVQILLTRERRSLRAALALIAIALAVYPLWAAPRGTNKAAVREQWEMSLDGGRKLTWQRSFTSEAEVKPNRSLWNKVVDVIAGAPDYHFLVRPYSIVTDSRGRIIISDPGAAGVHIFDFAQHKYKFIKHGGDERHALRTPQCVAVDAEDNIYVSDSDAGVVFEFERSGKYVRTIGRLKGGEGYFERPTGVAVDSAAQRMYVADTARNKIVVLDMQGKVLGTIGKRGAAEGEFNFPTELRLIGSKQAGSMQAGSNLVVVDALNFRVQVFDASGVFQYSIGKAGDNPGAMFRPKGVAMDSEGNVYVVDGIWGVVQVFNQQGQLLYYFGEPGTHAGEFQLPAGLYIDRDDRVFVVDSFNRRVQVFQYAGLKEPAGGK